MNNREKAKETVQFIKDRLHGCPFDDTTTRMAEIELESLIQSIRKETYLECAEIVGRKVMFFKGDWITNDVREFREQLAEAIRAKMEEL